MAIPTRAWTIDRTSIVSRSYRLVPIVVAYAVIILATHYAYLGDTMGYVQNILAFDQGHSGAQNEFWDFGHLLWRPLGWILYHLLGNLIPYTAQGAAQLTIAALFMAVNIAAGLVTVILLRSIAGQCLRRGWVPDLIAIAFLCFQAVLNYVHTGSSYIFGLMWVTLSFWAALHGNSVRNRIVTAVAGSLAVLSWFPYIVAVPGLFAASVLWLPPYDRRSLRPRLMTSVVTFTLSGLIIAAAYVPPIVALHIHSVAALKDWMLASSHGWAQNKRLLRLATGLPRSFVWIGNEGTLIKRYLLHDPYSHVSLPQIVLEQLWRVALFYIAAACLVWALLRSRDARPMLAILAAGGVPVLLFAVLIFEPGSMERYLPMYPFLCLAIAFCLSRYRQNRLAAGIVAAFLLIVSALNVAALWRPRVIAQNRSTEARALSLANKVSPQGVVAVVSLSDDLYQLCAFFPFDPVVRSTSLPVYDVIVVANVRVRLWRQDFARRAMQALDHGEAVWISKRLLASRPESSWGWNEGDDPNVTWPELPAFFVQLKYSAEVGGADGFLQLADSAQNRILFKQLIV